jgi:hypothetical protein
MGFGRLLWSLDHSIPEYRNIQTYKIFQSVMWRNLTEQFFLSAKGEPFSKHKMSRGVGISLIEMVTLFFSPFFCCDTARYHVEKK